MHSIHTTPGLIISSRPYGEAGKILSVFTRDFGLVTAIASGIRLEKSKLRYHTMEYSLREFSLVRGREFWRLTNAKETESAPTYAKASAGKQVRPPSPRLRWASKAQVTSTRVGSFELVARVALILRPLLHGEEAHGGLFESVQACVYFSEQCDEITDERMKTLESVTILRILHTLGYIGDNAGFYECLKSTEITSALLDKFADKRTLINQHINKALRESHL